MESGAGIMGARRAIATAVAAAVCATASLVWGVGSAHGAPGDLLYQGCLTGDPAIGPGGSNACTEITGASASTAGDNTGLNFAFAVAVSPDGTSLYALAQGDDAIARFSRSASTGALTYQDCITGETESGPTGIGGSNACSAIASHKSQGTDSGFDDPYGMVISPDSTSVYVGAQNDDSVAHFSRNTTTGALTYQGCISGEIESGQRLVPRYFPYPQDAGQQLRRGQGAGVGDRRKRRIRLRRGSAGRLDRALHPRRDHRRAHVPELPHGRGGDGLRRRRKHGLRGPSRHLRVWNQLRLRQSAGPYCEPERS